MATKKAKRIIPFHVIVFALFPVFYILAKNIEQMKVSAALRSILIAIAFCIILFAIYWFIFKKLRKVALLTSWTLLLFFTYGHIQRAIIKVFGISPLGRFASNHAFLIPLFLVVFILGFWIIVKKIKKTTKLTLILNLVSLILLVYPLYKLTTYTIQMANTQKQARVEQESLSEVDSPLSMPEEGTPPDIYYIILDAYTREDTLKDFYGLDNSAFLGELESMGFYVADCSRSNYPLTKLSLSTTLNLNYLDVIAPEAQGHYLQLPAVDELVMHSFVWDELRRIGYTGVALESGFLFTSLTDADYYLTVPHNKPLVDRINRFETLLVRSSAATILIDTDLITFKGQNAISNETFDDAEHVIRERFKLEQLKSIADLPSPKIVFAHIIIPHKPFIFRANGDVETDPRFSYLNNDPINQDFFIKGYSQQVEYVNSQILEIVQNILADSVTPPVIIIQGDHGYNVDKNNILNVYHLPEGSENLYPTISPVNSFRLIFNQYLGTDYELLPDISYSSTIENIGNMSVLEETNPACIQP